MINKIILFLTLVSFLGSSHSSNIEFEADKTFLDSNNEILTLEGNVSLKYENLIFKANKVDFYKKNNSFYSNELTFSSLDNYLYGSANQVDASSNGIVLRKVEFSSCPCEEKIWWIESQEINFENDDDFITAKKSKLIVNGKTLAYLNKANFPINYERKSGVLLPEISINERSGLDVRIPIYLNLKSNLDIVIEPRIVSQRGFGLTNELRYLGKNYKGFLNFSALDDSKSSFQILEADSLRWSIDFDHFQKVSTSTFFEVEASSTGDPFYLSDLGGVSSGLFRTYVLPNKTSISHFGKNYNLKTDINSFKLINPLGINQFQRLPGISFNYFTNKKNFSFTLDSDIAFFRKGGSFRNDDKQKLTRLLVQPKISYAYFKKNYLLETSFFIDYLLSEKEGSKNSEFLPSLEMKHHFNFYEKKDNSSLIIQPFLTFLISDQKNIINKNVVESSLRMSSLNENNKSGDLFISNQSELNIGAKFISKKEKKLLDIKIQKLFSFNNKKIFFNDIEILLPEPLSINIEYRLNEKVRLHSYFSVDVEKDYSSYKNSFHYRKKDFQWSLSHRWIENINIYNFEIAAEENKKINSLEISSKFNFSKRWRGGFKIIHDLEEEKSINSVISLDYENEGLILGFSYINSLQPDWESILENNNFNDYYSGRFRLYFELKGLGSLGKPKEDYLKRRSL